MQFIISKEPRLRWNMLLPHGRRCRPPSSTGGKSAYAVFWARNAIYHGLKALGVYPGDTVLVPSYHCAAAVEPILRAGATVTFYNIHRDCSPDVSDIQRKITQKTRALLTIHYFGFPQPVRQLRALCDAYKLYFIEDCAHVLTGTAEGGVLGSVGDISIFSWRKFLPLYDGGHLVVNNPTCRTDIPWERTSWVFTLKVITSLWERLLDDSSSRIAKGFAHATRFVTSTARLLLFSNIRTPTTLTNNSQHFDPAVLNWRMSPFSQYLMGHADFPAIIDQRRRNYSFLHKAVEALPGVTPCFPRLPEGVCPWVFPLVVQAPPNAHILLRIKGVPATTWGGVIHPDVPLEKFPDATFLYQHLIFLPIHQHLGDTDMQAMIDILASVLSEAPRGTNPCLA